MILDNVSIFFIINIIWEFLFFVGEKIVVFELRVILSRVELDFLGFKNGIRVV